MTSLPEPFFVLATQNPLEMDGTYPLPEAQVDRFLFKLHVDQPTREDMHTILERTTGWEHPNIAPVLNREELLALRHLAMDVPIARHVQHAVKADLLVANRMELRDGKATGRLEDPIVARFGGRPLRDFVAEHSLDLDGARAYGATAADQVLLAAIPWPCAVHPDRRLRRVARDLDWPIVET